MAIDDEFFTFHEEVERMLRNREVVDYRDINETRQSIILGMLEQFRPDLLLEVPYRFVHQPMDEEKFWAWCIENWSK